VANSRLAWNAAAYGLLVLGIIAQQNFCLSPVRVCLDHLDWYVALGSAVLGLAVLPIMLRWFNSKFRKPSWEHVLFSFSIGFFLALSSHGLKVLATQLGFF
jgi:hypothetical protein